MPIERNSETPSRDVLSPGLMLLWRRKWLLFFVGALTTIAGYFVMRLMPEEFKVRAEIFVNSLAVFEDPVSPEAASPTGSHQLSIVGASVPGECVDCVREP